MEITSMNILFTTLRGHLGLLFISLSLLAYKDLSAQSRQKVQLAEEIISLAQVDQHMLGFLDLINDYPFLMPGLNADLRKMMEERSPMLLEEMAQTLARELSKKDLKSLRENFSKWGEPGDEISERYPSLTMQLNQLALRWSEEVVNEYWARFKTPSEHVFNHYPNTLALEKLDSISQAQPNNPTPLFFQAKVYANMNAPARQLEAVNRALEVDANFVDALVYRGVIHSAYYRIEAAEADFMRAEKIDPENKDLLIFQGTNAFRKFNFTQTIEKFSQVLGQSPNDLSALYFRSRSYRMLGMEENMRADAKRALAILDTRPTDTFDDQIWLDKSGYHAALGDISAAVYDLQVILDRDSSHREALLYTAQIYFDEGDYEQSAFFIEKALHHHPDTKEVVLYNNLGYCYLRMGNPDRSILILEKAIALFPEFPFPYSNLGEAYIQKGQLDKAEEFLGRSMEILPSNTYAQKNLAL
ncbi:MAG: tetratricopeptide repeat protein, partial [Bacteroidota bacterium]